MSQRHLSNESTSGVLFTTRRSRWHVYVILLMLAGFGLVVWQRDRIRAHWWATRIGQVEEFEQRALYLACLAGIGDEALGAVQRLANDPRPDVAILSVAASSGLSDATRSELLAGLVYHEDASIRQMAATALAFMNSDASRAHLRSIVLDKNERPAAAALSGLARLEGEDVLAAFCKALHHANSLVRAQAVESLGEWLRSERNVADQPSDRSACDPVAALVDAMNDAGIFEAQLALEREIAEASAALTGRHGLRLETPPTSNAASAAGPRSVARIAAQVLSDLTGQSMQPGRILSMEDRRKFIEACRRQISDRRHAPELPPNWSEQLPDRQ